LKTECALAAGSVGIMRRRKGTLSPASAALARTIRAVAKEHFPRTYQRRGKDI
jgi:hypothetical protein